MSDSLFEIRGVIEGFYGPFYTPPERNDLIRFMEKHGYNLYIYGPKNDRQHRARWRDPYPTYIMDQFEVSISLAKDRGIDFCYSIGLGVDINYASMEDLEIIKSKFLAFYDRGVRTFGIMLDDIASELKHEEEQKMFTSCADAQSYLCNALVTWLKELDRSCKLMLCPTDYHGSAPFSDYVHELGNKFDFNIDVFYTGDDITTSAITELDAKEFADAIQRDPIIWDNYPVNDLAMNPEMHIGPITGRDPYLYRVSRGFIVNTMSQAEASKIAMLTFADYFNKPEYYDAWKSWETALKKIGGKEHVHALKTFAENSLQSCLNHSNAQQLKKLTEATMHALESGENVTKCEAINRLHDYLDSLDEAGYHLKFRITNYALRNNLLPWIELMESWAWTGRRAIAVLKAIDSGSGLEGALNWFKESLCEVEKHPKQITGNQLQSLIDFTKEKVSLDKGVSV